MSAVASTPPARRSPPPLHPRLSFTNVSRLARRDHVQTRRTEKAKERAEPLDRPPTQGTRTCQPLAVFGACPNAHAFHRAEFGLPVLLARSCSCPRAHGSDMTLGELGINPPSSARRVVCGSELGAGHSEGPAYTRRNPPPLWVCLFRRFWRGGGLSPSFAQARKPGNEPRHKDLTALNDVGFGGGIRGFG